MKGDDAKPKLVPMWSDRTHWEGCWGEHGHHDCAVARIERLERELAELRGRGAGPVAGEGGVSEEPVAWDVEAYAHNMDRTPYRLGPYRDRKEAEHMAKVASFREGYCDGWELFQARIVPLYAHPPVSAGERRIEGWDPSSGPSTVCWQCPHCGQANCQSPPTAILVCAACARPASPPDSAVLPTPTEPAK